MKDRPVTIPANLRNGSQKTVNQLRKLTKRQLTAAIPIHQDAIDSARVSLETAKTNLIRFHLKRKINARQTAIKEIEALQKEKNTSNEKDQTVLLQRH